MTDPVIAVVAVPIDTVPVAPDLFPSVQPFTYLTRPVPSSLILALANAISADSTYQAVYASFLTASDIID